jgi:hypothetical protein
MFQGIGEVKFLKSLPQSGSLPPAGVKLIFRGKRKNIKPLIARMSRDTAELMNSRRGGWVARMIFGSSRATVTPLFDVDVTAVSDVCRASGKKDDWRAFGGKCRIILPSSAERPIHLSFAFLPPIHNLPA